LTAFPAANPALLAIFAYFAAARSSPLAALDSRDRVVAEIVCAFALVAVTLRVTFRIDFFRAAGMGILAGGD
jgi:hypothetical protein